MLYYEKSIKKKEGSLIRAYGSESGNSVCSSWGAVIYEESTPLTLSGACRKSGSSGSLYMAREILRAYRGDMIIGIDDDFLVNGMTRWVNRWQRNGWRTVKGNQVQNKDLWREIIDLCEGRRIYWRLEGDDIPAIRECRMISRRAMEATKIPS